VSEKKLTKEDLIQSISRGCKPKKLWKIGTEHEKFGFKKKNLKPICFKDISKIFTALSKKFKWRKIYEGNNIISLRKNNASITLEPGGQIELSGSPLKSLFETCREVNSHQKELDNVCKSLDIDFMGMGVLPKWGLEDISIMPKERYKIMSAYMPKVGTRGLDMMLRTTTIQANYDFSSEEDMIKKFRVSQSLQPAIIALYANSPFVNGKLTKYLSYRSYIWTKTDKDRCGLLPFIYDECFSFERYVDYLLDVPMYFAIRNNKYLNFCGHSFRHFMEGKIKKFPNLIANISDWNVHMTTVFPEVRLKAFIELRGADGGPWSRVCALPAFWAGILYDEETLDKVWDSIKHWKINKIREFYQNVRLYGLRTVNPDGEDLAEFLKRLLNYSSKGLEKRNVRSGEECEKVFLEPLWHILRNGRSPGETWKNLFISEWSNDIDNIYKTNYFKILKENEKV